MRMDLDSPRSMVVLSGVIWYVLGPWPNSAAAHSKFAAPRRRMGGNRKPVVGLILDSSLDLESWVSRLLPDMGSQLRGMWRTVGHHGTVVKVREFQSVEWT